MRKRCGRAPPNGADTSVLFVSSSVSFTFLVIPPNRLAEISKMMEHLCPTCAALRSEWLEAIEKWSAVKRSNDLEQELAGRLAEQRAFCNYVERHHACEECIRLERESQTEP